MGRRASNDSGETFDKIVAAAAAIVAESGAAQLTLRRVASETGLRLGTVQYYFASKDALVSHMLGDQSASLDRALAAVREALAGGADVEEVIVGGIRAIYRQSFDERETHRLRILWSITASEQDPNAYVLLGQLHRMARVLEECAGLSRLEARFLVHSVSILVARYSVHGLGELRTLLGLASDVDPVPVVEEHLSSTVRALFREARARSGGARLA